MKKIRRKYSIIATSLSVLLSFHIINPTAQAKGGEANPTAVSISQTSDSNDVDVISLPAVDIQSLPAIRIDPTTNTVKASITDGNLTVDGAVDAFILNGAPSSDDFIILRQTEQVFDDTTCTGIARPLEREFTLSPSDIKKRFVVPDGRHFIVTDFVWAADLREFASPPSAVAGRFFVPGSTGSFVSPWIIINEGDPIASGSEHFNTGPTIRSGSEICITALYIRANDNSGPYFTPLSTGRLGIDTRVIGYLVDN